MTAADDSDRTHVVPVVRVRECIDKLLSRDTHPHFIAYLYLRSLAGRTGSLTRLTPNWSELGKRLEVPGGPPSKPYAATDILRDVRRRLQDRQEGT